jgi:cold shock CspA family protein
MTGAIHSIHGRGFGFIAGVGGRRYFFHARDLADATFSALRVGDPVAFDLVAGDSRGDRAVSVRLLTAPGV